MIERPKSLNRSGVALLEVLVALTLIGTAGSAWIALAAQSLRATELAAAREAEIRAASMLLGRLVLESSPALARRAGRGRVSGFDLLVSSSDRRLFEIVVLDTLSGAVVLRSRAYPPPEVANGVR